MNKPLDSDTEQINRIFMRRVIIAGILIFIGLGVLILRYGYLQVYAHEQYETQADNNRIKLISAAPSRGYIYDRNGILLADNQPVFTAMMSQTKSKTTHVPCSCLPLFLSSQKKTLPTF